MKLLRVIEDNLSRVIFYSLLASTGATKGIEGLVTSAKVIGIFEVGY